MYSPSELVCYFGEFDVPYRIATSSDPQDRWTQARKATHLLIAKSAISAAEFDRMPRLKAIVKFGRGVERIDLEAATKRGVVVAYTPFAVTGVAEGALLLMLALSKHLTLQMKAASRRVHPYDLPRGSELAGKTLGIVGFGAIGRSLASMAHGMGMQILVHTRTPDPAAAASCDGQLVSLDELLEKADYVSLNLIPLPDGRPLLDESRLAQMKDGAVLINTARGSLVDEGALVAALESGKLAGAGLDVVADEPVQPDNPLLHMENVIVTPHSLGVTEETMRKIKEATREALELLLAGRLPPYIANPGAAKEGELL
jgi:D-3-phosphoglycerate dehydrogenase